MKKRLYASLMLLCGMLFSADAAENLLQNGDAEADLENWEPAQVQVVTENPHSGKSCFKTNTAEVIGTAIIPVDGTKTYKYSGWFKSADDKKSKLFFGFSPMTADKKKITAVQVNIMKGTETVLTAGCIPEDSVIKIKDASTWDIKDDYSHIAFNIDDSGEYKDLPNATVSAPVIVKVEKKNDIWEVTLKQPCGMTFAADTKVRVHKEMGYMYSVIEDIQSKDWKEITANIKGTAKSGSGGMQFWPGTKYVKIVFLVRNGGMIYFDDVKLEEVN